MTAAGDVLEWLRALPGLERCFFQPHHEVGFLVEAAPEAVSAIEDDILEGSGPLIENAITDLYFLVPSGLWPAATLRMRSYAAGAYAGTVTVIATSGARAYERVFVAIVRGNGSYDDLVAQIHEIIAESVSDTVLLEVKKLRRAVFPVPFRFRCGGALATDYCNVALDRLISVRRVQHGEMLTVVRPFNLENPAVIEVEWAGLGGPSGEAALRRVKQALNRHRCRYRPKRRRKVLDLLNAR